MSKIISKTLTPRRTTTRRSFAAASTRKTTTKTTTTTPAQDFLSVTSSSDSGTFLPDPEKFECGQTAAL
jgi:hypothetical protein